MNGVLLTTLAFSPFNNLLAFTVSYREERTALARLNIALIIYLHVLSPFPLNLSGKQNYFPKYPLLFELFRSCFLLQILNPMLVILNLYRAFPEFYFSIPTIQESFSLYPVLDTI